jgi:hypothetical protein
MDPRLREDDDTELCALSRTSEDMNDGFALLFVTLA